eukprot:jgi/Chlat1/997/Chrsp108S01408
MASRIALLRAARTSTSVLRRGSILCAAGAHARALATIPAQTREQSNVLQYVTAGFAVAALGAGTASYVHAKEPPKVDYQQVRKDIEAVLEDYNYDDGSFGPVVVRLAWHCSGTYDKASNKGGSDGATMRFMPESGHAANRGLDNARLRLEEVAKKHPNITYADLWTLAGCVAIEEMGKSFLKEARTLIGDPDVVTSPMPAIPLRTAASQMLQKTATTSARYFTAWVLTIRRLLRFVAPMLSDAAIHRTGIGYKGPWTNSPTTFSNEYYVQLTTNKWSKKKWNGPLQYEDPTGELMMLPTDMELIWDPSFRKWTDLYAADQDKYFEDFAKAFKKLIELGVEFKDEPHEKKGFLGSMFGK